MFTAGLPIQIAFLASVALIWLMILYQVFMTAAGFIHRIRSARLTDDLLEKGGPLPPVSILIPARNEEVVIESTVAALQALEYPGGPLEIVIVDDGSTDRTGEIVEGIAAKDPRVRLLRLPVQDQGRGKSHALNTAFRTVRNEIVAVYDADNRPEPNSLEILVRRLLVSDRIGAVLGQFRTINRSRNLLTAFINLETLAFQGIVQAGRCAFFKVGILPGTNFVIRKKVLEEAEGWDEKAITEDTELSIRIYELGWTIDFAPEAVSWEEEPERFRVWLRQRTRWVRGNFYVLRKFLFSVWKFKNKFLALQVLSLSLLYYLFLASVLVSHLVFLTCLLGFLRVDIPGPYTLVWLGAFLLFVAELFLISSYEGEHSLRQVGIAALMYFTYCQAWLFVVFRALWFEYVVRQGSRWDKTVRFGTPKESLLQKPRMQPTASDVLRRLPGDPPAAAGTGRTRLPVAAGPHVGQALPKGFVSTDTKDGPAAGTVAPAGPTAGGTSTLPILPLVGALFLFLGGSARGDTVLEAIRGEKPWLDSHWGELYGSGTFETYKEENGVAILDLKDGFRLARLWSSQLFVYGKARAYKDTVGEFWNNKATFGPGIRLRPFESWGLYIFGEYLYGVYYGIEADTPNPYDPTFSGVEAGAAFWQRWGVRLNETRFFLPFTGWRELYADGIYFQRDDDNFIMNAQGREAFGAVRLGPMVTDLYLRLDGAYDSNADFWNNYVQGGLGARFRPASEDWDVHLDVELIGGAFIDRAGRYELTDDFDPEYIGARIELSFWFGW
jgi:cellulose synthase/poly-beta-1,6-N-acetylglucosamine synthase-like glycosyltransferase